MEPEAVEDAVEQVVPDVIPEAIEAAIQPEAPVEPDNLIIEATFATMRNLLGDHEVRRRVAFVRERMTTGNTLAQIIGETEWPPEQVLALRAAVYGEETLQAKRRPEEIYVDYALRQEKCIKDLNDVIRDGAGFDGKGYGAVVSAIRAQSDIYDRIIKMGQDIGVLKKISKNAGKDAEGMAVEDLSNKQLQALITKMLMKMHSLVRRYGAVDDLTPLPVPTQTATFTESASAEKAHKIAGRGADRAKAGHAKARQAKAKQAVVREKWTAPVD